MLNLKTCVHALNKCLLIIISMINSFAEDYFTNQGFLNKDGTVCKIMYKNFHSSLERGSVTSIRFSQGSVTQKIVRTILMNLHIYGLVFTLSPFISCNGIFTSISGYS